MRPFTISAPTKRDPSPPHQGWFSSRLYPPGAGSDTVPLHFSTLAQALTAPPTKRCCGSTATTSRLPWGPASSPSLGSGTLSDVTNGELPISWANKPQLSINLSQPSAPHPILSTCTCMFTEALFTTAEWWKQSKCPSTVSGQTSCGIYIHTMEF